MHKIDSDGHDNNQFVDEDANNAIAGTTLAADWLNALQEELINILILAGINPSKAEDDQLAQAFNILGGSKDWADIINKSSAFPSLSFGTDQFLIDKTAIRIINITYTNTTARPILVLVDRNATTVSNFYINNTIIAVVADSPLLPSNLITMMIPSGFTYKFDGSEDEIVTWFEITSDIST